MAAVGNSSSGASKFMRNFVMLFILLALVVIINGKLFVHHYPNIFLLGYGISVTTIIFITFYIAHTQYRDPVENIFRFNLNAGKKMPFISIIVAAYNEEKLISQCVDSLIRTSYKNREIIVVNDGSTDGTAQVLGQYEKYSDVKILNLKQNIGKKKAIAEGLRIAKGELFVFTDSDSVLARDAVERIVNIFVFDDTVGAVSGHGRALNAEKNIWTKIQDSWYEGQYSIKKAFESVYGAVTCVSGPLAVFRREAVYNYVPAWANDRFLAKEFRFATDRTMTAFVLGSRFIGPTLQKKFADSPFVKGTEYATRDWKIVYCKSAKVWTKVPETIGKIFKQHIRWKKSFIRSIFLTGTFYWRKPFLAALRYYLGIIYVFMGPFIVFRHLILLPASGQFLTGALYLGGIFFVGLLYGILYKLENPKSDLWVYRPLMSLMSTLVLSWFIFYSILTIRKNVWHRG